MAWARQSKSSGKWGGVYRDAAQDVQYLPMTHRFKTEAQREAAVEEQKARRGQRHDPAGARVKWGQWADEWWPTRGVEASTEAGNMPYLKRCRERWGSTPIGMISRHDLQAWVRTLSKDMAASSVRQAFYLVSSSLNAAIAHGMIDVNPCTGVDLPVPPPATERFLSDVEISSVMYHLDERYRILGELLLDSGMRLSEACGLHWERVNLEAGTLTVVETWDTNRRAMKAYPKGRRIRTVPLTGAVVDTLVHWHDQNPDVGSCGRPHVVDDSKRARARAREAERVRAGKTPNKNPVGPTSCRSSLVIPGSRGAPIDGHNFSSRQWAEAVRLATIAHATPHALRHTYASRLLTAGVPIARVSKLLGHASVTTTERYAYLQTDGFDDVRAALERRLVRDATSDAAARPAEVQEGSSWMRPRAV